MAIMMPVDIDSMSAEDRIALIDKLWVSLYVDQEPQALSTEKRAELDRRLERHRQNPERVDSLEDIESDLDSICGD